MALNAMVAVYVERKVSAFMMDRLGPMGQGPGLHAGKWGILQTFADAIKLLIKEDTIPKSADQILFKVAPFIIFIKPLSTNLLIKPPRICSSYSLLKIIFAI